METGSWVPCAHKGQGRAGEEEKQGGRNGFCCGWEAAGCRAGVEDVPSAHPVLGSLLEAPLCCWGQSRASTQDCPLTSLDHLPPQCRKSENLVSQSSLSAAPEGAWAGTRLVHPAGCSLLCRECSAWICPDMGISSSPTRILRSQRLKTLSQALPLLLSLLFRQAPLCTWSILESLLGHGRAMGTRAEGAEKVWQEHQFPERVRKSSP